MDDIRSLPRQDSDYLSAWIEYLDGFTIRLRYLGRAELRMILRAATIRRREGGDWIEEIDDKKLIKSFADCILDWRGLTPAILGRLLPVNTSGLTADIPCTEANKLTLLTEAYDFDEWVRVRVMDLAAFRAEREEAEVNNLYQFCGAPPDGDGVDV